MVADNNNLPSKINLSNQSIKSIYQINLSNQSFRDSTPNKNVPIHKATPEIHPTHHIHFHNRQGTRSHCSSTFSSSTFLSPTLSSIHTDHRKCFLPPTSAANGLCQQKEWSGYHYRLRSDLDLSRPASKNP